jgi:hypothetical protein
MGDRANVVIRDSYRPNNNPREAVFLYSHWGGTDLPEIVREALAEARNRWNDESYLARMIFDRMIGDEQGDETGFGISTRLTDNEYDLIVLHGGRLYQLTEKAYVQTGFELLDSCPSIAFEDYIAVPRTWENLT